jgi:farnesyl-diphosphate farnesyltransferase
MSELALFTISPTETRYLNTYMNKVSRSFALVVPVLEEPLNHYLSTAYLICRVVDNIEDCEQPFDWKQRRFNEFSQLIYESVPAADILTIWGQEAWPGLNADERELMEPEHGLTLWKIYAQIPPESREIIARWTATMAQGMGQIEDSGQTPQLVHRHGLQILADEDDYNRYCFFVAGTVGHMATELVINHYRLSGEVSTRLIGNSEACGRGLQKTNIVKDFAKDLARGVCYLPDKWMQEVEHAPLALIGAPTLWRQKVVNNVLNDLDDSVQYLLDLPYHATGYRMASLLCLLPAYQTLLLAAQRHETLFTIDHYVKISRQTMAQCIQDAQTMIMDNEAIRQYSHNIKKAIGNQFAQSPQAIADRI